MYSFMMPCFQPTGVLIWDTGQRSSPLSYHTYVNLETRREKMFAASVDVNVDVSNHLVISAYVYKNIIVLYLSTMLTAITK